MSVDPKISDMPHFI